MMPLFFSLLLILGQAQDATVDGVVKDSATRAPLYGVQVGLVSGAGAPSRRLLFPVITDDAGHFHISAPPGDYTLRAQRDGYFGHISPTDTTEEYASRHVVLAPKTANDRCHALEFTVPGGVVTGRFLDQFWTDELRFDRYRPARRL